MSAREVPRVYLSPTTTSVRGRVGWGGRVNYRKGRKMTSREGGDKKEIGSSCLPTLRGVSKPWPFLLRHRQFLRTTWIAYCGSVVQTTTGDTTGSERRRLHTCGRRLPTPLHRVRTHALLNPYLRLRGRFAV